MAQVRSAPLRTRELATGGPPDDGAALRGGRATHGAAGPSTRRPGHVLCCSHVAPARIAPFRPLAAGADDGADQCRRVRRAPGHRPGHQPPDRWCGGVGRRPHRGVRQFRRPRSGPDRAAARDHGDRRYRRADRRPGRAERRGHRRRHHPVRVRHRAARGVRHAGGLRRHAGHVDPAAGRRPEPPRGGGAPGDLARPGRRRGPAGGRGGHLAVPAVRPRTTVGGRRLRRTGPVRTVPGCRDPAGLRRTTAGRRPDRGRSGTYQRGAAVASRPGRAGRVDPHRDRRVGPVRRPGWPPEVRRTHPSRSSRPGSPTSTIRRSDSEPRPSPGGSPPPPTETRPRSR